MPRRIYDFLSFKHILLLLIDVGVLTKDNVVKYSQERKEAFDELLLELEITGTIKCKDYYDSSRITGYN